MTAGVQTARSKGLQSVSLLYQQAMKRLGKGDIMPCFNLLTKSSISPALTFPLKINRYIRQQKYWGKCAKKGYVSPAAQAPVHVWCAHCRKHITSLILLPVCNTNNAGGFSSF